MARSVGTRKNIYIYNIKEWTCLTKWFLKVETINLEKKIFCNMQKPLGKRKNSGIDVFFFVLK